MLIQSQKIQRTTNNDNNITVLAFLPESEGPSEVLLKIKLSLLTF